MTLSFKVQKLVVSFLVLFCTTPYNVVRGFVNFGVSTSPTSSAPGIVTLAQQHQKQQLSQRVSSSTSTCLASSSSDTSTIMSMKWFQHELSITAPSRGCHLITNDITKVISKDLSSIKVGMCNIFVQHTSASLTINENADPDVRRDMEVALNKIVPAQWNRDGTFLHTLEGDDDMVRY